MRAVPGTKPAGKAGAPRRINAAKNFDLEAPPSLLVQMELLLGQPAVRDLMINSIRTFLEAKGLPSANFGVRVTGMRISSPMTEPAAPAAAEDGSAPG